MTVWEIVIIMLVATLCATLGIGFVYSSIVNTVERYQVRKTKRELEIYTKVMEVIPDVFKKIVELIKTEEERKQNEFAEKIKKMNEDLDE